MKLDTRHFCLALLALGSLPYASAQQARPGGASAMPSESGYVDLLGGLAYTDNALLRSSGRTSDGLGALGFSADFVRQGNFSLNLLGNLERLQYLKGTYGGSFYGRFFGSAVLGKPTDVLQWQLSDSFGEEMTNPLASPTPLNLQTINYLATGPLINLHFGLTNRLTLSGLYSRTTYQRSPFDSQTYEGGAQFRHALSGASSLSLEASASHTRYIEPVAVQSYFAGASNYDIRQASILYRSKFVRTELLLRAGYNTIQYGGGAARHGAPQYEVRISRRISPFSTLYVDGRQSYSTNGTALSSPGARVGVQVGNSLNPGYAVAQPFNQRSVAAGWLFNRARTSLSLTGSYGRDSFDQTSTSATQYNRREENVAIILGRQLRPTMRVQLRAQGYWDRYADIRAETRRQDYQLTLTKRFVKTTIGFYVERLHQSGSPGVSGFSATSYNDDRVGLYVTYDLFGERPMGQSVQGMAGMGMGAFMGGY